jgi:hypothetical protein
VRISADADHSTGRGLSTDVIEASARAYVNALNRLVRPAAGQRLKETGP